MAEQLTFPPASAALLKPHLPPPPPPPPPTTSSTSRPFVTLTFATSLDSSLSLAPGVRTRLSGPESKAMTHYLRSWHDAILIGVSTMLADDPALNCRIAGAEDRQPRPIIVDPHARWRPRETDKVLETCRAGKGKAPFVLTGLKESELEQRSVDLLQQHGGQFIHVKSDHQDTAEASSSSTKRMRFNWNDVLSTLASHGLSSVMVEGGGQIINSLLQPQYHDLVDSVIVTIAPTWLGKGGVVVSPDRVRDDETGTPIAAARLQGVQWLPLGEDVVLCGKLTRGS